MLLAVSLLLIAHLGRSLQYNTISIDGSRKGSGTWAFWYKFQWTRMYIMMFTERYHWTDEQNNVWVSEMVKRTINIYISLIFSCDLKNSEKSNFKWVKNNHFSEEMIHYGIVSLHSVKKQLKRKSLCLAWSLFYFNVLVLHRQIE